MDQHMAGRESRMAAQLDLRRRRKPAEVVVDIAVLARDGEGRFAEIVLGGDRLHQPVVEPALERHDGGGVAGQRTVGEGVDLKEGYAGQVARSVISWGSMVSRS